MPKKTISKAVRLEKTHVPPKERTEFNKLVAINPNYFGNLEKSSFKSVKKMVGNTSYEEVSCVGYNPALSLLEATVQIKRPGGYNGNLCAPGSMEHVRFFIDYGGGWIDVGLASFNAHDIPTTLDCAKDPDKPLTYVVTLPLDPERDYCKRPVLPNVRAILSWQAVPAAGDPNWTPVWGNVVDQHIQIKPREATIADLIEFLPKDALNKLPPLIGEAKPFPIPLPDPSPLSLANLATLYAGRSAAKSGGVEPHRFGLAHIQAALASNSQEMLTVAAAEWKAVKLDFAEAVAVLDKTKADVSYEELECLGFEYNLERLVATFRIKKPAGYSGELCSKGSLEYVAFWADWNDTCTWTYLNTVAINVHDISTIPADGLAYSAILPVDVNAIRRLCSNPKISRIRAVLSWNTPPSTVDPDALNHWGNRIDTHVQIPPGAAVPEKQPNLAIIGGIGIAGINVFGNGMTNTNPMLAKFASNGTPADALNRECPFGGLITVQGLPVAGHKYRLWARKFADPLTEEVVKNPFYVVNWLGIGSTVTPDPVTGYVAYLDIMSNLNNMLAYWRPQGDELWQIRIELADLAGGVVGTTPWYNIQLDNTRPRRKPAVPPFEPPAVNCEIHIDSGGDCKDFTKGTLIEGRFVARDAHFGSFRLRTLPASMSPPNPTTATPSTTQTSTFAAGGDAWKLDTSSMQPCGYVVLLEVWDRAIVNSVSGSHNYNSYDVGFCLRA